MGTEAGSRARCEELFFDTVNKIPKVQAQLENASNLFSQTREVVDGYRQEFTGRGRLHMVWGHILDTLRIAPIIPTSATEALQRATQINDSLAFERNHLLDALSYFGRHLPGTHRFLGLHYNPFDNPPTPYQVSFVIHTRVGARVWKIHAQGEFTQLLYQSTSEQNPHFFIPRPDQESPVLLLPRVYRMSIERVGYVGPGEYDRFVRSALWEPKYARIPKPIEPQEFVYEQPLPRPFGELVLSYLSNPRG